ncbi:hypothetical protein PUR71_26630 [Streptomyces sp. SP17BM10]|uniref:hypothetical protein n=1 Tax=Streptomyces sp. SP17BM10 TaxID=3002530 RepID=UPI002E7824ED|nr:hypothetical protein [Streptomyces sp. SP17BM10]MEE1786453.1 hypothetical protein [Streptomyces sp. SP17BM10]
MDRPLRLPQQDRADFETVLNRALAGAAVQAALRATGDEAHGAERLRRCARDNAEYVLAAAAPEYERYAALRADADAEARRPADEPAPQRASGWLGVLAVIVPMVSGAAAGIFLLIGYALGLADDSEVLGGALVGAGWVAAGLALVSALAGGIGLAAAASRSRAAEAGDAGAPGELALARDAWRTALAERGMVPYLVTQANAGRGGATAAPGSRV